MNKQEAKDKIEALYHALYYFTEMHWNDYSTNIEKMLERLIIYISQENKELKNDIERTERNFKAYHRIKELNLIDEFIKDTCAWKYDISEALKISTRKATNKIKKFDFTEEEKDIILKKYCGSAYYFLEEKNLINE